MRLALKVVLVFVLANAALAGVYGYLAVRREVRLFQQRADAEASEVGPLMQELLAQAWQDAGDRGVLDALRRIVREGQQPTLRVRWVWFDAEGDAESRPSVPLEALATITQEHLTLETNSPDGTSSLHVYWPVPLKAARRGGLEFSPPMAELEENKQDIIQRTGLLVAGMLVISGFLAMMLGVRFIARPLEQLMAKARRIGGGDLDGPVHLETRDELAELAEGLNAMCANLAESQRKLREETGAKITALEQLRHADRLKTVGRLASGIAHELGTPLNVVAGRAELIASGKLDAGQVAQSAAAIKSEAARMTQIIRQLLDFARASTPHKQPVDLRKVVSQTIDMLGPLAERRDVQLCFNPGPEAAVARVDAGQIQQVLTNLAVNAAQAMPQGGKVEFAVVRRAAHVPNGTFAPSPPAPLGAPGEAGSGERGESGPAAFLAIEVRDHGVGIAEEDLPHLFEPFFTTKEVGAGTGLGLSIAHGIVEEHGGWIDVASKPGAGSCFTVYLPEGEPS